ncbi:MAG: hypothetical protein P1U86_00425 [Verrucomicrobiales bacterium]|nr:hypothetical protein [Verrucomicrobiales bacterium]
MMKPANQLKGIATASIAIAIALTAPSAVSEEQAEEDVRGKIEEALDAQEKSIISATEASPKTENAVEKTNQAESDAKKEEELSPRDLALKDHHEQLKIYDLDLNGKISEEEWKAANKKNPDRNGKFNLVDKDKDGEINDDEAIKFLMQRISVESTYVGESDDNGTENVIEDGIEENAPSELRFTLFSIPLGD